MIRLMKFWVHPTTVGFFLFVVFLAACNSAAEEEAAENLEPPDHLHDSGWLVTAYENSQGELVDVKMTNEEIVGQRYGDLHGDHVTNAATAQIEEEATWLGCAVTQLDQHTRARLFLGYREGGAAHE